MGDIIAVFKYQATRQLNASHGTPGQRVFQRSFHDRIIRDDKEHYLVEHYISLNPLMWHLDRNNPGAHKSTVEQLRQELVQKYGLDEYAI